ncbi:hypothetical protein ACFQY0_13440 [Haloferula chungangensis]|uniref:MORN repeat variant n=1 Tax=Haloferula chungangensis TaxID=1048331 RepID=A0ABW2LB74_9BACT
MKIQSHTQYHKDGSVWAVGQLQDGASTGYWEWFRKDGTKSRSGSFENGHQVGEWTTYDKTGQPYKVTIKKPKSTAEKIAFKGGS